MPPQDAPLRILITNSTLTTRTGTSVYTRDTALELQRRGHRVACYSLRLGAVARELSAAGLPCTDRLGAVPWQPDVIHGNSHQETVLALARFRNVPALFVCHDHTHLHSATTLHPRVRRYLAVSRLCLERLLREGAPPALTALSLNSVDLTRYLPRGPLPPVPRRALVFSNYAGDHTHLPAAREACRRSGLQLDVIGLGVGNATERPEIALGQYDVVFAKAKAALEAMAVGTAVVLCDFGGVGPLVTTADYDRLRPLNFGFEALTAPLEPESLLAQIALYDPDDAARVRDLVRGEAGLEAAVGNLEDTYRRLIAEHAAGAPGTARPGWRQWTTTGRVCVVLALLRLWAELPAGVRGRLRRLPGANRLRLLAGGTTRPRDLPAARSIRR